LPIAASPCDYGEAAFEELILKKLAIVTGGSKGIGERLVQSLLKDGPVLNISRAPARPQASAEHMHKLHNLCLDLSDIQSLEIELKSWLGSHPDFSVSLFVSNAATLNLGWLSDLSALNFQTAFAINTHAPISIASLLWKLDKFDRSGARIVYVTSSLGRSAVELSFAGIGLYSATKAALGRLATIQRREFSLAAPHITVTQVHPGIADTAMQADLRRHQAIDPAFAVKTAGLPYYKEGDWEDESPAKNMRTIPAQLAADFLLWISGLPGGELENDYDFYACELFHKRTRRQRPAQLRPVREVRS